jgi:hypothetical protein
MIGISLRYAISLGLHLRNTDPTMYESRRDTITGTWWTAYSIECLLSIITDRPPVISEEYCTVPLPNSLLEKHDSFKAMLTHTTRGLTDPLPEQNPFGSNHIISDEAESSTTSYVNSRIRILLLIREAQRCLYSPRTATRSWEVSSSHSYTRVIQVSSSRLTFLQSIQTSISGLLDKLETWRETEWPSNPEEQHTDSEGIVHREQFILKTDYWSTKILLTQPCLSRLGRRIENQIDTSAKFDLDAAEACVTAALEIARLLPAQPDARFIYATGPWWAIIHTS